MSTLQGDWVEGVGVAGTPNGGVVSIQGVAGGTALPTSTTIVGTVAVDVTDEPARQLGIVSITGTPTVDVTDRAARLVGVVDTELPAAAALADLTGNPTAPATGGFGMVYREGANGWDRARGDVGVAVVRERFHALFVNTAGGANAIATLTLPAPGAGLFQVITYLRITRIATAALVGGAILTVTTTNILGAPQWRTGNLMVAGGTTALIEVAFNTPLRASVANTAVTVVCPAAGAAVSWDIQAAYYLSAETK